MENRNLKPGILVFIVSGMVVFFAACKGNNDYTKSPATESETPANADTAMKSTPVKTDTTSASSMSLARKKTRFSVGTMASKTSSSMKPDKNGVYEMTEVRPAFPGGHEALVNYINDHIEYPQSAIDNNVEGTVDVQFVVDENGSVSHAKVIGNKSQTDLDNEAVQVVSNMPKWSPGKVKGKNVKTRMVLPITYKMEG